MRAFWKKAQRKAATRPTRPTAWSRFLDHAVDCADCRTGERCALGNQLHQAVKAALAASAP